MQFHDRREVGENLGYFFVGHDGQDLILPPNPQGGTLWKYSMILTPIFQYFQGVPPWELGADNIFITNYFIRT